MEWYDLQQVFDYLSGQAVWWGLLILMISAMIEYLVPPFPGDTITLAGAVLIPAAGWPFLGVLGAVTVGSLLGAAIDWKVGAWVADNQHRKTWIHRQLNRERVRPKIDKLIGQFERHGAIYLTLNRFVPAFRSVFFIAAGMARIVLWKVLLFACLSALLWNGAILAFGYFVGYNIEVLGIWIGRYSTAFYLVVGFALLIWFVIKIYNHVTDDG
jgi:membrane protein DedA with SNARE-associated domain